MKNTQLFSIGNALVDIEFLVSDAFLEAHAITKGQMTLIDAEQHQAIFNALSEQFQAKKRVGGGSAANSTVVFSQLGGNASYHCRVADDEYGQFYTEDLKQQGVQCEAVYADGVTGKCLVLITPDAERTMLTYLGATADLAIEDIDFKSLAHAEWLFMEGYLVTTDNSFAVAKMAIKHAKEYGTKIALSFSDPVIVSIFHEQISELLSLGIDVLFANEDEVLGWSKQEDVPSACEALSAHADKIIVTLGAKGCAVHYAQDKAQDNLQSEKTHYFPTQSAQVVDTNGAGDAFAGAFLYANCHAWDDAKAGELSNKVAAVMISQFGARRSKEEIVECR